VLVQAHVNDIVAGLGARLEVEHHGGDWLVAEAACGRWCALSSLSLSLSLTHSLTHSLVVPSGHGDDGRKGSAIDGGELAKGQHHVREREASGSEEVH